MPQQLLDFTGEQRRDDGIERAINHANAVHENWSDRAFHYAKMYIAAKPKGFEFATEDLRIQAEADGLADPPSKRAYGGIISKVARQGLIRSVGTRKVSNPRAHACFASVWQKI